MWKICVPASVPKLWRPDQQRIPSRIPSVADTENTSHLFICHKGCELRLIVIELRQHPSKLIETYSEVEVIYCHLDVMNSPIPGCQVAEKGLLRVVCIWWGWKSRQLCFRIDRHVGIRDHVESLRLDSNREWVFWLQAKAKQTLAQCVYVRSDTIGGCLTKPKCVRYGCACNRGQTAVGQYEAAGQPWNAAGSLRFQKSLSSILKSSNLKPLSKL